MLKIGLIKILVIFSLLYLDAQNPTINLLQGQDTIIVTVNEEMQIIYTHEIKAKQTIYNISKTFGCRPRDIFELNNINANSIISIGQIIEVPISSKYIDKTILANDPVALPVIYKVKPGETLYSISKRAFHQPVENMIARNSLASLTLGIDQQLLVGYLSLGSETGHENSITLHETASYKALSDPPSLESNNEITLDESMTFIKIVSPEIDSTTGLQKGLLTQFDSLNTDVKVPIRSRGIAKWDKNGQDKSNLFVMHREAKINSIIKIRNPMNDRTVEARVVGQIQPQMVREDIQIIMSPAVANRLGILDKRAQVEMMYFED